MERPVYVECSDCGFFHTEAVSACDGAERHIPEDLDEQYGEGGWVEIAYDPTEEPQPMGARANFERMMALTPETDIEGNRIEVGCRVRCFDSTRYDPEHDGLLGLNIDGRCSYIEGVITEITKYTPPSWHEGVYYLVETQKSVSPVIERSRNDYTVRDETQTLNLRGTVHILANGSRIADDALSFGVVRLSKGDPHKIL